ncbi:hypothetical protein F4803DRAFT_101519 [Xylaria telfairii]|nr:hypothetical protein F4803DRAFT_101519 [Xylaria telfairii]
MAEFETPTIQNHLRLHVPYIDWEIDDTWKWPFRKFGFTNGNVLFNELHAEFNSIRCAIQDPYGWHLDVCEIANATNDREEFFSLLRKRQDERYTELQRVWHKVSSLMVGEPSRWDTPQTREKLWVNFVRISRNFSYDAFVGYFGAYVKDKQEHTPALTNNAEPKRDCQLEKSPNETDIDERGHVNSQETEAEQSHRDIDRAEGTRAEKQAETKPPGRVATNANRVTKRQKRPRRAKTPNQGSLRRSSRLQQTRRKSW